MSKEVIDLAMEHGGKFLKLADLAVTAQDALIYYMSVDGAAWAIEDGWEDWKWGEGKPETKWGRDAVIADIAKFRGRFIEKWGHEIFGYSVIPYQELLNKMHEFASHNGFKYHPSQDDDYEVPTWPVILSEWPDEIFEDGWTRFGMYCLKQLDVPVVWFAKGLP